MLLPRLLTATPLQHLSYLFSTGGKRGGWNTQDLPSKQRGPVQHVTHAYFALAGKNAPRAKSKQSNGSEEPGDDGGGDEGPGDEDGGGDEEED